MSDNKELYEMMREMEDYKVVTALQVPSALRDGYVVYGEPLINEHQHTQIMVKYRTLSLEEMKEKMVPVMKMAMTLAMETAREMEDVVDQYDDLQHDSGIKVGG